MFSTIRKRVTYANVAMTLALVFAMSGGAYAAKHYLITSTKQISPKVLTALKGKNGTNGTNGTNGANGKDGAQGAAGAQGPAGEKGSAGEQGPQGTAGPKGTTGPEGVCSTSSCHLPTGVTETGEWTISQFVNTGATEGGEEIAKASISFTVPLASNLVAGKVHLIKLGEGEGEPTPAAAITSKECEGTYKAPKAASGNLCVFAKDLPKYVEFVAPISTAEGTEGADRSGAQLSFFLESKGEFIADGTWAVTG
jgi:hypothetical protein